MPHRSSLRHVDPLKPRSRLYYAFCRLSITPVGMWLSKHVLWKLDPYLLRLTRGRLGSTGIVASGLLETRGAVSGLPRRTATLYFHDADRVIIVASKLGWPTHPAWYHNLRRHPEVVFGGQSFTARVVEDDAERESACGRWPTGCFRRSPSTAAGRPGRAEPFPWLRWWPEGKAGLPSSLRPLAPARGAQDPSGPFLAPGSLPPPALQVAQHRCS